MSIVDQAAEGIVHPNIGQGFDMGAQLVQRQQALQQQQQQIDLAKQNAQMQKQDYLLSNYTRAINTEDPGMKRVLLDHVQKVGDQWQMPLHEDMYALAQKSEDWKTEWNKKFDNLNALDPNVRRQMITSGVGVLGKDVGEASKTLQSITQPQEDILKAQMSAATFGNRIAASGQMARLKDIQQKAIAAGTPGDIVARISQGDETAVQEATPYISKFNQQQGTDKHNNINSQIQRREDQTDLGQQAIDQRGELWKQRLGVQLARLNQGQQRIALGQETKVDKVHEQYTNQLAGAQKIQALADNPNMTWVQYKEAGIDAAQLSQIKMSAVVSVAREQGYDPKMLIKEIGKAKTWLSGKLEGTVPPELREQLKTNAGMMALVIGKAHDMEVQNVINSVQRQGAWGSDPSMYSDKFKTLQFGPGEYLPPAAAAKAQPYKEAGAKSTQGAPAPVTIKVPSQGFMQQLMQKIPDQKTREAWLKSKSYQIPGAQ